ncbi:hypothetical protein Tco_0653556 [Tanacetum coccineum]|uniref:Uncharacterized protein n=1 Tax=Tanacetum coccineum TaxID=301880 RepID=A0ABQ4X0R4_9ASTR
MQHPSPNNNYVPQPSFNMNYMQQPIPNLEDISDPTTTINMPSMNTGQDREVQMVGGWTESVQNPDIQNVGNQNRLIIVLGIANQNDNQNRNGNVVEARAEGNGKGNNEEAGIQLQAEEFDLMLATTETEEIEEVNANCILMANLQQASTSRTQTDKAPFYDSDGSDEVHQYEDCYDNEIFNMFTQEEQYTKLLEPISEPNLVQQDDSNVIPENSSMAPNGGEIEQHPATVEETHAYFESLYNRVVIVLFMYL